MDIFPNGSRPLRPGPAEWFTGEVFLEPIAEPPPPARARSVRVRFSPGARTAWHTHPLGQTLYVLSGCGRIGTRTAPPREITQGDTVWIPPGEAHWHGAAPDCGMEHIAIQEAEGGHAAVWMELVRDEDYLQTCR
ncbi:(R)-mandelonitrile lyase [Roseobacteraceae bacterium NS-SX3]